MFDGHGGLFLPINSTGAGGGVICVSIASAIEGGGIADPVLSISRIGLGLLGTVLISSEVVTVGAFSVACCC